MAQCNIETGAFRRIWLRQRTRILELDAVSAGRGGRGGRAGEESGEHRRCWKTV